MGCRLVVAGGLALLAAVACAGPPARLRLVRTIRLEGVEGRIDHMTLDATGQRLFVVALGNNSLEVLDLASARRVRSVTGLREPQGVGVLADPPRLFVANGGDGTVAILDAGSLRVVRTIALGDDADNVRVDSPRSRAYVGYGNGGLAVLDAGSGAVVDWIALPGHPEAFEWDSRGTRIYVNVPDANEVCVVDRSEGGVVAHWKLAEARANFPMALDSAGGRLFVGCRRPARILVRSAATGRPLSEIPIDGDVDGLFYDARTRSLFASCGAGFVDVVEAPASGPLHSAGRIPTAAGARTSLFDPARGRLFLAVPHRGAQAAEIRVFELAP